MRRSVEGKGKKKQGWSRQTDSRPECCDLFIFGRQGRLQLLNLKTEKSTKIWNDEMNARMQERRDGGVGVEWNERFGTTNLSNMNFTVLRSTLGSLLRDGGGRVDDLSEIGSQKPKDMDEQKR